MSGQTPPKDTPGMRERKQGEKLRGRKESGSEEDDRGRRERGSEEEDGEE